MKSKVILCFLLLSVLLNAYLLFSGTFSEESVANDDLVENVINDIRELRKTEGSAFEGYFLGESEENWPPKDNGMEAGIYFWFFDSDGTARNFSISPTQKWKNEDGKIYIQWPSEDYRYYGRFDGEFLTEDQGDYQNFFFRAE